MPGIIVLSDIETGSNADILASTRLQNAPSNGIMTFEMQAADAVAANRYDVSLQMPSGDTPLEGVLVPAGPIAGLAGQLNEREMMKASFPVQQGGHTVFSVVETGDTEFTWRLTFSPI